MDAAIFSSRTLTRLFFFLFLLTVSFLLIWQNQVFPKSYYFDLDRPEFYFDFLTFRAGKGEKTYLEVFCQVPTNILQFIKSEQGFSASYELSITIYDQSDYQITGSSYVDSVHVPSLDDIQKLALPQVIRFTFFLYPGKYKAKIRYTDLETYEVMGFTRRLEIESYDKSDLIISDLQLATSIEITENENSVLVKNKRKIIPNLSHVYGLHLKHIYVYTEIYNFKYDSGCDKNQFKAQFVVTNEQGMQLKTVDFKYKKPGETSVLSVGIPVEQLKTGKYILTLNVTDLDNGHTASRSTVFHVIQPYANLTDQEFVKILRQLSLIASPQEIAQLKALPAHERNYGLYQFWAKKDPTPGTKENEFMIEFYRRIYYANAHFYNMRGEGWETDQGEIYIKYGAPDFVDRFRSNEDNKVYEVWEYFQKNQKFVFLDYSGYGEFRLVNAPPNYGSDFSLHDNN